MLVKCERLGLVDDGVAGQVPCGRCALCRDRNKKRRRAARRLQLSDGTGPAALQVALPPPHDGPGGSAAGPGPSVTLLVRLELGVLATERGVAVIDIVPNVDDDEQAA